MVGVPRQTEPSNTWIRSTERSLEQSGDGRRRPIEHVVRQSEKSDSDFSRKQKRSLIPPVNQAKATRTAVPPSRLVRLGVPSRKRKRQLLQGMVNEEV
jgi:hypothetical protein